MLPDIVEVVLEYLSNNDKGLLEYKVLGGSRDITTIILKFADLSLHQVHDLYSKSPVHEDYRQHHYYRSPRQYERDNERAFNWHSKQYTAEMGKKNDSGVFTPGSQGAFSFPANDNRRSMYDSGTGKRLTDQKLWDGSQVINLDLDVGPNVCGFKKDVDLNVSSHRDVCIGTDLVEVSDRKVQCELSELCAPMLVEQGVQYEAEHLVNVGVQCDPGNKVSVGVEVKSECEGISLQTRNVGLQCKVMVHQNSKRSQTEKLKTAHVGLTCTATMHDSSVQTVGPRKVRKQTTISFGCQTERNCVSRHTQVSVNMSNVRTQTKTQTKFAADGIADKEIKRVQDIEDTCKGDTLVSRNPAVETISSGVEFDQFMCNDSERESIFFLSLTTETPRQDNIDQYKLKENAEYDKCDSNSEHNFNPG